MHEPAPKRQCVRADSPYPSADDPDLDAIFDNIDGLLESFEHQTNASNLIKRAWRAQRRKPSLPVIYEGRRVFQELSIHY